MKTGSNITVKRCNAGCHVILAFIPDEGSREEYTIPLAGARSLMHCIGLCLRESQATPEEHLRHVTPQGNA
jgi:hypothetical protein